MSPRRTALPATTIQRRGRQHQHGARRLDPTTKKYVGTEAVIKAQIAQVQADKKINAKDKKEALADLNEAMKTPVPPIENKGNIDLVAKYYDKLADALGDDEE